MFTLNFLARLKNKTFLITFLATFVAFVYQVCALVGFVPPITQDETMEFLGILVTLLANIGILIDPTTDGMSDSELVMSRNNKRK